MIYLHFLIRNGFAAVGTSAIKLMVYSFPYGFTFCHDAPFLLYCRGGKIRKYFLAPIAGHHKKFKTLKTIALIQVSLFYKLEQPLITPSRKSSIGVNQTSQAERK
jgi:hypothetical protein